MISLCEKSLGFHQGTYQACITLTSKTIHQLGIHW